MEGLPKFGLSELICRFATGHVRQREHPCAGQLFDYFAMHSDPVRTGCRRTSSVVAKSGAKIAIPHHYLVPETTFVTSTLLPATEWAQTHEHTMFDTASIDVSKSDLEGKSGHVFYFGSNNMATEMAKEG